MPVRPARPAARDRRRRRLRRPRARSKRSPRRTGRRVIHRPVNGGPGGGAQHRAGGGVDRASSRSSTPTACREPGWLDRLLPHFADPAVGAVAPRIVPHEAGTGWLARYEGASSTLDMGARPSIVRPGARVSYVPGAALVVRQGRRRRRGSADGMFVGEDVDFIWRLVGGRLAGPLRAVRDHGARPPGHVPRLVLPPRRLRHLRRRPGTAAPGRGPPAVRLLVDGRRVGGGARPAARSPRPALTAAATALLARRLSRVTGERWPVPARPG